MLNKLKTGSYPSIGSQEFAEWAKETFKELHHECRSQCEVWSELEDDFGRFMSELRAERTFGLGVGYSCDGSDDGEDIGCNRCGHFGPEEMGCRCWEREA